MPKRAATYHLTEPALAPPQKKGEKSVNRKKKSYIPTIAPDLQK